jgi:CRISPR/Cas system-associated exonuclease Cas4 (RecB family)
MAYKLLSKSKYLSGLQCPKYLWIQSNDPERIPETDPVTQYIFDQGHLVGELARKLFPGGIDIPTDDFMGNINQTKELLEQRKPLFEAGILAEDIYSRVDILNPSNETSWDIIEVKSTTSVKDVHLDDVAFQKYCCEKLGLKIEKTFLMHINNQYVKEGEIDPEKFFTLEDITEEVEQSSNGIQDRIADMLEVISATICPEVTIGKHCSDPYDCALTECWEFLPEYNIFNLYYGGKKSFDLFSNGIITINEIPDSYKLNDKQRIQQASEINGKPHVDREGISNFLGTLQYPLYYLDFETISPAVPLFNGTRPYQAIPFQFSLHVAENDGSKPKQFSFLASDTGDFRPTFLAELKKVLGDTGSIVVYNQGFEEGILKELALAFPEYDGWVNQVRERLVDLLSPFRQFHYYNPLQKGSASLKSVLPALTGKGYNELDISDGQVASIAFQAVTYGNVSEEERNKVRSDLEKYCGLDTEGMIWIVDSLRDKLIE